MDFELASQRLVLDGPVVSVYDTTMTAPDGSVHERQVVRHPGAVAVVPLVDSQTAVLVRQYRVALGEPLLEIPAGKRDVEGEPPEVTAAREVAEEIGYEPTDLEFLAGFYTSPGFCDERALVYLARGLRPCEIDRQGAEEQHMDTVEVALGQVPTMIAGGELRDAKTIIGLLLAAEHSTS